jgi:hypothetical protein
VASDVEAAVSSARLLVMTFGVTQVFRGAVAKLPESFSVRNA